MKKIQFVLVTLLLVIFSGVSRADPPVVLTKDKKTAVNLMDTDLVKKKDMLDCQLRLVGNPPHYRLMYSLGEIEVPTLAVKVAYEDSHRLLAVKASISGVPVSELFVRYQKDVKKPYKLSLSCPPNSPCYAPVAYVLTLDQPEHRALSNLRSHHPESQIDDSSSNTNVDAGAIMVRDRPNIETVAPDGLGGEDDKNKTELHYVCATD